MLQSFMHALLIIFVDMPMCPNVSNGSLIDSTTTTETPEDTNVCSALEGWLAASIVIIIILTSLCVALIILSVLLYMKYRKCQNDVAPGTSATYKPPAKTADPHEVKVNA